MWAHEARRAQLEEYCHIWQKLINSLLSIATITTITGLECVLLWLCPHPYPFPSELAA